MNLDPKDDDPPAGPDTQDLLRRTRQGDRPARQELILYWMHRAHRYTSGGWCRNLSEDDRRDVQLKSVFKLIDKAELAATSEELDRLLLLTVRGKVSDARRKARRRKELDEGFQPDQPAPVQLHGHASETTRRPPAPPVLVVPVGTSWVNRGPAELPAALPC